MSTTTGTDGVANTSGTASGSGSEQHYTSGLQFVAVNSSQDASASWKETYSNSGVSLENSYSSQVAVYNSGTVVHSDAYSGSIMAGLASYGQGGSTPCFAAGTRVIVGYDAAGQVLTKKIEEIQAGDLVLAKDEKDPNAPLQLRKVTAVLLSRVDHQRFVKVMQADGTTQMIRTTDDHPFWVEGLGWTKAKDLQPGQTLLTPDGKQAMVVSTKVQDQGKHPIKVYSLSVEGDHTFFVAGEEGQAGVWVHNQTPPGPQAQGNLRYSPSTGRANTFL